MIAPQKPRALILDDEPPIEKLFTLMMPLLGWEFEVVTCPEKALSRLKSAPFNVVISDYHLSLGNGLQFICCLRKEQIMVPAIVMSGDLKALRLVPKDLLNIPAVLLKPFTISEVRAVLGLAWTG